MNTSPADADLLAAAQRSAERVSEHDRSGWVALFTPDARIEDPVGSLPHTGLGQIERFYDTFIAPRDIEVCPLADFVAASVVVRDALLRVSMGPRVHMEIPAVLRYAINTADAELNIRELKAYWELPSMLLQFARQGIPGLPVGAGLSYALLRNQGLRGSAGFMSGFRRPGRRMHAVFDSLLVALTGGDELAIRRILGQGAMINVTLDELSGRLRGARWDKVIAAGREMTASLTGGAGRAVVIAEFTDTAVVRRLQFFG